MELDNLTMQRIVKESIKHQKENGGYKSDYIAGAKREAKIAAEQIRIAAEQILQMMNQLKTANDEIKELANYLRSRKFQGTENDYIHISTDLMPKIERFIELTLV